MIFTCGNVVGDLVGAKIVDQTEQKLELQDSEPNVDTNTSSKILT